MKAQTTIRNILSRIPPVFLVAFLALITACVNPLEGKKDNGSLTSGNGYSVTLSFADSQSATPIANGEARTIRPYFSTSSIATYDVRVYDALTATEVTDPSWLGIASQSAVSFDLPSIGPWRFVVTAYDEASAVIATGENKAQLTSGSSNYVDIPMRFIQTPGQYGNLDISMSLYNLPVPTSSVALSLKPVTAESPVTYGTEIDLTGYRVDNPTSISISSLSVPVGNYRLWASFTYNSRTFHIVSDPRIMVCDNQYTSVSISYDYANVVREPTLTFNFSSVGDYSAIAGKRVFVTLWNDADYYETDIPSGYTLYETPEAAPVGYGLTTLDAVGNGTAAILDPTTGSALDLPYGSYYRYTYVIDTDDSLAAYTDVTQIPAAMALYPTYGDRYYSYSLTKTGSGVLQLNPADYSVSTQFTTVVFLDQSGVGTGLSLASPASYDSVMPDLVTAGQKVAILTSNVTTSSTLNIAGSVEIRSLLSAPFTIAPTAAPGVAMFAVGGSLTLTNVVIDGSGVGGLYTPAVDVGSYASFTLQNGAKIQNWQSSESSALNVFSGSAIIKYASMTGNTGNSGGAVYVSGEAGYQGSLQLFDGAVLTGNAASSNGGAVYVGAYGFLGVSQNYNPEVAIPIVSNNSAVSAGGEGGGIYVDAGGALTGSYYWLNGIAAGPFATVLSGNTANVAGKENFAVYGEVNYSDITGLYVSQNGTGTGASSSDPAAFELAIRVPGMDYYYMMGDVALTMPVSVTRFLSIDSYNGTPYRITPPSTAQSAFSVETGGELHLNSCAVGYAVNTATTAALITVSGGGNLAIHDYVTLSGSQSNVNGGAIYILEGVVSMNGANSYITNNNGTNGGAVYMGLTGSFSLTSGTISNNTATNGGGVYLAAGGASVYLNGGSITGNTATSGGGVYAEFNSFLYDYTSGVCVTGNSPDNIYNAGI